MPEETQVTPTQEAEALTASTVKLMIEQMVNGLDKKYQAEFKKFTAPKPSETTTEQADPKYAALERTLADLTASQKAAEDKAQKAEQRQALGDALGTYTFTSDRARSVAMQSLESQVQRSDNGSYFIGDRDLRTAVKEQMKELTGLLAPVSVGSSGAIGTQSAVSGSALTMQQIRDAKTPETLRAVADKLKELYK